MPEFIDSGPLDDLWLEPGKNYSSSATVIQAQEKKDLFYMNMKVFKVKPFQPIPYDQDGEVFSIWCAVYHVSSPIST